MSGSLVRLTFSFIELICDFFFFFLKYKRYFYLSLQLSLLVNNIFDSGFWQIDSLLLAQKRGKLATYQNLREKFKPFKQKQQLFLHNLLFFRFLLKCSSDLLNDAFICFTWMCMDSLALWYNPFVITLYFALFWLPECFKIICTLKLLNK